MSKAISVTLQYYCNFFARYRSIKMKLFLFTTLVSCSLVFAQETGPVVAASNCFNGTFTNGTGGTEGEVPCNFDDVRDFFSYRKK